jgi:hypothetical protein
LLLAAPVSVTEIVNGQWRALVRMFGVPVGLLLAIQLAGACWSARVSWGSAATQAGAGAPVVTQAGAGRTVVTRVSVGGPVFSTTLLSSAASVVTTAANLIAISWFGMWMGMTSKNNNLATLKPIAFVQVIPGLVIGFASALALPLLIMPLLIKSGLSGTNSSSWAASTLMNWYPLVTVVLAAALHIGKDIGFVLWSHRKLHASFRLQAVGNLGPVRPVASPPPIAAPPVIGPQR